MTSFFYDVIRLEAVRGGLNVPIEGHFWRFWTPKCCWLSCGPQKGISVSMFWVIVRRNPCTGHFSRRVREKINKKREVLYFTYFTRRPYGRLAQILRSRVRLMDVINCAKFYRNRLSPNSTWLVSTRQSTRLISTRLDRFDVSRPCILAVSS